MVFGCCVVWTGLLLRTVACCTYHTTSQQGLDPQWTVYDDRRCYAQANTATTYKEIRILTKYCIFICFVQIIQTTRCAHNTAVMYYRLCASPPCKLNLPAGLSLSLSIYIYIYIYIYEHTQILQM